jgi:predicted TIM-barrel fold metal-dependent hydrolase
MIQKPQVRSSLRFATGGLLASVVLLGAAPWARAQTPDTEEAPAERLLLKDYRPRVIHEVPRTAITRARFPIIDMHSHPYARTPEQIDQWVRTMDELGIEKTIVMTGAVGERFDQAVELYARHPDRFSLWCGFDYSGFDQPGYGPDAVAELRRCFKAGAEGVGEVGDKGSGLWRGGLDAGTARGLHIDHPRLDPLLGECARLGLPVNVHVAEPIWMYEPMDRHNDGLMNALEWRLDNKPDILGHGEVVATLDRALGRHPDTTFIACHFANCSYDLSILGRMLDDHPNLYADIAARFAETAPVPRYTARFYEKYADRLLYGTDMGFERDMYITTLRILQTEDEHFYDFELFDYHWPLHGLGLADEILKKVFADNARKILEQRRSE